MAATSAACASVWHFSAAKQQEHVAADRSTVRIISDNPICAPDQRSAEELNVVGRIRWFAMEI